jgi:hypothetical protein
MFGAPLQGIGDLRRDPEFEALGIDLDEPRQFGNCHHLVRKVQTAKVATTCPQISRQAASGENAVRSHQCPDMARELRQADPPLDGVRFIIEVTAAGAPARP